MRIVVDFPAPLGPRKPVTVPGFTTKSSPSTAVFSPYLLVNFRASIIRVLSVGGLRRRSLPAPDHHARSRIARSGGTRRLNRARRVVPRYYASAGGTLRHRLQLSRPSTGL